jgi:hypothetical protein
MLQFSLPLCVELVAHIQVEEHSLSVPVFLHTGIQGLGKIMETLQILYHFFINMALDHLLPSV